MDMKYLAKSSQPSAYIDFMHIFGLVSAGVPFRQANNAIVMFFLGLQFTQRCQLGSPFLIMFMGICIIKCTINISHFFVQKSHTIIYSYYCAVHSMQIFCLQDDLVRAPEDPCVSSCCAALLRVSYVSGRTQNRCRMRKFRKILLLEKEAAHMF